MLVQQILDFIDTFKTETKLIQCDKKLIKYLAERFVLKTGSDLLIDDDIQFLLNCYKIRWEAIIDSENDYTRNPSSANLRWIDLARKFEPDAKKNYLKILIPNLINERDLNDLSSLKDTVNLFNFYLGYGGTTLFRKRSLCEHLKTWEFALSTYRGLSVRKLSPVTVDELTRLKLCQHTTREVTVGTESFANFWDFMRKKIFIHLSDRGHIPIGLLPHLLELIERYYYLRSNGSDLAVFKNDVTNFFSRLYRYELADVNFMYGAKLKYKENEEYLLDVFIALQAANDFFALDFEMKALSRWLFQFNPILKASSKELGPIYDELHKESPLVVGVAGGYSDALARCCGLLVSLLTTQFEMSIVFARHTDSLWDKENTVFPEASGIFTILLPLIAANRPDAIASAYGGIIRDIIAPAKKDTRWYTFFTRNKQTARWLDLVNNCQLSEVGAHWFEPEIIFSALLHFNTNNQIVRPGIHAFLDDLIHTYAQDQNDLMKQCRVNILFTEFINSLSENQRKNLLILIKLCDLKTAKSKFLSNCALHVNERLSQICQSHSEATSPQFFSSMRKLDSEKLFLSPEGMRNVGAMITEYKTQLLTLNLDAKTFDRASDYLVRKIGRPILTLAQKELVNGSLVSHDYIGQYT